jgi:arsenate reductase
VLTGTLNKSFIVGVGSANAAMFVGDVVATAGLVWIIGTLVQNKLGNLIPVAVAAWVLTAATFTATGAQANPAVSFGLAVQGSLPTTYAGPLVLAQVIGVVVAIVLLMVFAPKAKKAAKKK